jgi:hypothetical protein
MNVYIPHGTLKNAMRLVKPQLILMDECPESQVTMGGVFGMGQAAEGFS